MPDLSSRALTALSIACIVALAGCATAPKPSLVSIDCTNAESRCHEGRFGLSYRITRKDGVFEDAVNGTWRWESLPQASVPVARLDLSTVLGTRLASVEQTRRYLLLTDNSGKQYMARDWDDLFQTLFELKLPGEAIAEWMNAGARPTAAPLIALPGWEAQMTARRLRLSWQQQDDRIRIDLIPDTGVGP